MLKCEKCNFQFASYEEAQLCVEDGHPVFRVEPVWSLHWVFKPLLRGFMSRISSSIEYTEDLVKQHAMAAKLEAAFRKTEERTRWVCPEHVSEYVGAMRKISTRVFSSERLYAPYIFEQFLIALQEEGIMQPSDVVYDRKSLEQNKQFRCGHDSK